MGNHIAETRSAAGMSKTTLCYTGVSKERENENLKATRAAIRETLPVDYITIAIIAITFHTFFELFIFISPHLLTFSYFFIFFKKLYNYLFFCAKIFLNLYGKV